MYIKGSFVTLVELVGEQTTGGFAAHTAAVFQAVYGGVCLRREICWGRLAISPTPRQLPTAAICREVVSLTTSILTFCKVFPRDQVKGLPMDERVGSQTFACL